MAARRTEGAIRRTKERREAASGRHTSRASDSSPASGQQTWRGASGALYEHIVTSLIFCPTMPKSTFLLVHRDDSGAARVLRVGALENEAKSLNLAHIRQLGASLGANEVHIRAERASAAERARIVFDIENALSGPDEPAGQAISAHGTPTLA